MSDAKTNLNQARDQCRMLSGLLERIEQGASETARAKHLARGKMLVRERIAKLIDPDTSFLELSMLAAHEVYDHALPAAGILTGIGKVSGRDCVIIAHDATVKGGCYFPLTVKKHLRALTIALQSQLPCLYLVDSGGAYLPLQADVFPDQHHFGRLFYLQAQLSAKAIPQIAVVMGSCTAGGAYIPAMADQCIMVRNQAKVYLAGPPLVQAATGEVVSDEELGGALMHHRHSGLADFLANDEAHALQIAKRCIADCAPPLPCGLPRTDWDHTPREADALYSLINADPRYPMDMHLIIDQLVDLESFHEFKPLFGPTLICGTACWKGYTVGIIANQGILMGDAAIKGCHFVELSCSRKHPLIFLQNVPGFMVGKQAEMNGIARHGAKMVMAVANARVPKLTVITGGSYGAGNYAMCGRAYDPHFLFTWPNAKTAVMGPDQAAQVLVSLQQDKLNTDDLAQLKTSIQTQYTHQSSALYGSARLWDDGVIDPAQTRELIARTLDIILNNAGPIPESRMGLLRV